MREGFFKKAQSLFHFSGHCTEGVGKERTCKEKMHRGNILLLLLLLFVVLFLAHDNFVLARRGGQRREPKCKWQTGEDFGLGFLTYFLPFQQSFRW